MLKIDEVFEGLKCCSEGECAKCPYDDDDTIAFCTGSLCKDALKLIALISILLNEEHDNGFNAGYEAADNEIIKCSVCRFYQPWNDLRGNCELHHQCRNSNWFCGDGMVKDNA